jgi:hypothetical protein
VVGRAEKTNHHAACGDRVTADLGVRPAIRMIIWAEEFQRSASSNTPAAFAGSSMSSVGLVRVGEQGVCGVAD